MDDMKTKLSNLSDQELRQFLEKSGGYDGTPVTPSTRMLLVRKLTRDLLKGSPHDDAATDKSLGIFPIVDNIDDSCLKKDSGASVTTADQNPTNQELNPTYYGVNVPKKSNSISSSGSEEYQVFTDKKEVIKFMKDFPHARFKVFRTKEEAEVFARGGIKASGNLKEPLKDKESTPNDEPTSVPGEKTSSFKAPKPQDLIQLRKIIERSDVAKFLETVWKNPRYMVSSGDTPTILQEGSRYNALHIACKVGYGPMVEAILETVCDPAFISLLYDGTQERGPSIEIAPTAGKDQAVVDCIVYLQDLYLNTPEKGLNETPLHFACKFGKVEAVKVLMSYPACDRMRLNKFGETAEDVICSRAGKGSEAEKEIRQILKDCFYVPVIRPGDSSLQASVGDPFSPERLSSPVLALKNDPKSPAKEINAFAGPMSLDKAQEFCLKLKSPLRIKGWENENIGFQTPNRTLKSPGSLLFTGSLFRLCDPERGLEREGRALAKEFHVGWKEYWPFAGVYTNLGSKEGMQLLENYLHKKLIDILSSKKKTEDDTLGNVKKIESIVTVDETDTHLPSQQMSPISDLCLAMESCNLSSTKKLSEETKNPPIPPNASAQSACQPSSTVEIQPCPSPFPLHYVEKSCCIFSRRISDLILRETCGDYKRDFSRVIGLEVNHLRRLVSSFKDDNRFTSINFSCMHSRVACLAAEAILESLPSSSLHKVLSALEVVHVKNLHLCSSSDEEDDRHLEKERNAPFGICGKEWRVNFRHGIARDDCTEDVDEHTQCLMSHIKEALVGDAQKKENVNCKMEETNIIESLWAEARPCTCSWPTYSPHYHSKPSNRSLAAVVRRLSFHKLSEESIEHSEKHGDENSKMSENQMSLHNIPQESDMKDICLRYRKISDDGDHSSREELDSDSFYTPPSSPISMEGEHCSSGEEEMLDSEEMPKVFIGGEYPTKEDVDVLNALENGGMISPHEFPHIYQWRNLVLMHTHEERERWPSPYSPRWIKHPRPQCVKSSGKVLFL